MSRRQITKASSRAVQELKQLFQSIFALELARPGRYLWLTSPWISDIPVIDNTLGSFQHLHPDWPKREWTLCEVLVEWLRRSEGMLRIVTRPISQTDFFRTRMDELIGGVKALEDRYSLTSREILHQKVFLGDRFLVDGSMNWTYSGLELWDEHISFSSESEDIHQKHLDLVAAYGELP